MMTCNLALTAALLFSTDPALTTPHADHTASAVSYAQSTLSPLASESAFAALVSEAVQLKQIVDGWMVASAVNDTGFLQSSDFTNFKSRTDALAKADMDAHLVLKQRGTDGDLTCILRGIAEDMPKRLASLEAATAGPERYQAMEELAYLLNDNAEVIMAPPVAP